ncbi:hypothetical protein SEVIR_5G136951v4 [Setaria viridis]|uniref:Uncharacterized protein n=1 Tax=Setaria viridis TaxID=4556 RepID=A0A4U6UFA9_SETVI|nr:hypothetical protein SEVIR_5G136950v2 [Setaria viridis]
MSMVRLLLVTLEVLDPAVMQSCKTCSPRPLL